MLLDQQLAPNKCLCNTQTQRSDVKHLNKTLEHKSETFEVCSSTGAQASQHSQCSSTLYPLMYGGNKPCYRNDIRCFPHGRHIRSVCLICVCVLGKHAMLTLHWTLAYDIFITTEKEPPHSCTSMLTHTYSKLRVKGWVSLTVLMV